MYRNSGSLGGYCTGTPGVTKNSEGKLEVFVRGGNGSLWTISQVEPNGGWSVWSDLRIGITGDPVPGIKKNGHTVVFYVNGIDIYYIEKSSAGNWSRPILFSRCNIGINQSGWVTPVLDYLDDGRLIVFFATGYYRIFQQIEDGRVWTAPVLLCEISSEGYLAPRFTVAKLDNNQFYLAIGVNEAMVGDETISDIFSGTISEVAQLAFAIQYTNDYPTGYISNLKLVKNREGRLEFFFGKENRIHHAGQYMGYSWGSNPHPQVMWRRESPLLGRNVVINNWCIGQNENGRIDILYAASSNASDNNLLVAMQSSGNIDVYGWSYYSSILEGVRGQPCVGKNEDGRLELFVVGSNSELLHAWQGEPNFWTDANRISSKYSLALPKEMFPIDRPRRPGTVKPNDPRPPKK